MAVESRFLPLTDVAEVLNVSVAQARALVRSGDLWRVEKSELEDYIQRMYAEVRAEVDAGTAD